jgi:hypothetical protein
VLPVASQDADGCSQRRISPPRELHSHAAVSLLESPLKAPPRRTFRTYKRLLLAAEPTSGSTPRTRRRTNDPRSSKVNSHASRATLSLMRLTSLAHLHSAAGQLEAAAPSGFRRVLSQWRDVQTGGDRINKISRFPGFPPATSLERLSFFPQGAIAPSLPRILFILKSRNPVFPRERRAASGDSRHHDLRLARGGFLVPEMGSHLQKMCPPSPGWRTAR